MTDLVKYSSMNDAENCGKNLYKRSSFYKGLADIMESSTVREFFGKYVNNMEDISTLLLFVKVYQEVERLGLTPYQKLAVVHSVMSSGKLIGKIIQKNRNELGLRITKS